MDIYVECPICHNKYKSITNNHLIKKHGINIEKFRDMYPDYNLDSEYTQFKKKEANREIASRESVREKRKENALNQHRSGKLNPSKSSKEMWKLHRDEIVQKMKEAQKRPEVIQRKSEIMKDRWKDDNFRTKKLEGASNVSRVNKISKSSKEMWKLHRDEIVQKMKEAQKRPEVIQRKSEIMKDRWKDDNFRNAHRNKMQELFSNEEWCKRINTYKTYSYSSKLHGNITLRSSYELRVCIMLDSLNIKYEYETKRFKYTYNGIERLYIVDFYLPDYDLYLEVKPKVFENDDKVLAKFNSVRKQGKNIIFIDEDCIYDTNKFNNIIITSTTI